MSYKLLMRSSAFAGCALLVGFAHGSAHAEVIHVGPSDSFTKIESARAGDEVVLAPGTYRYRVHLTAKGTPDRPIVIRALDPKRPPVWDLGATLVEHAPGSSNAPDRGRGCWQLDGAEHVRISGIVVTGCRTKTHNSAGLRYYNGAKGIVVQNAIFRLNDNGLTGGTQRSDITVEHSEFDRNGNLSASSGSPSHNIYVYGGTSFTLRYSYVHDPVQAENFHIRSKTSTIEYCWFARAKRYEGDLMTDDDATSGPYAQEMLFRGNVVVQSPAPTNKRQIIALYNDARISPLTLSLKMISNTFVVAVPRSSVVHLSNADGTVMTAEISNNVFSGGKPTWIEDASKATVTGTNNWLLSSTDVGALTNSVFGAAPPFKDAARGDYTLAAGSNALGGANAGVKGLPDREYFENERTTRRYRMRATVKDIGAFESTTVGPGLGPELTIATSAESPNQTSDTTSPAHAENPRAAATTTNAGPGSGIDDGCGCRSKRRGAMAPMSMFGALALALAARLRLRRAR